MLSRCLDRFERVRCKPHLATRNRTREVGDPCSDQVGVEVKLRLVEQEQSLTQPEAIDLADKKRNLTLTAAQLVERQFQTSRVE